MQTNEADEMLDRIMGGLEGLIILLRTAAAQVNESWFTLRMSHVTCMNETRHTWWCVLQQHR